MTLQDFGLRLLAGAAQVPATPLSLYGLANRGVNYVSGMNLPGGQYAEDTAVAYDRGVRSMLGITPPQTTGQVAMEALGNVAVAPPRALFAAAPLADRLLRSVFVTPRSLAGRGVDTGVQTAVGSAILNYDDLFNTPAPAAQAASITTPPASISSQPPTASASQPAPVAPPRPSVVSAYDQLFESGGPAVTPQQPAPAPAPVVSARQASPGVQSYDALFPDAPTVPPPSPQRESPLSWTDVFIAGAAAMGGAATIQALTRRLRSMPARDQGALTGSVDPQPAVATGTERVAASLLDESTALTGAVQRANPGVVANDIRNRVALDFNTHAVTQRIKSAWESGDMEGVVRARTSFRAWTDSVAALPDEVRPRFNDYLFARNEQDNIRLGTRARPDLTEADVAARVAAGDANPVFRRLAAEWDDLTNTTLRYAHQRGLLTQDQYNYLSTERRGYMPQTVFENAPKLYQRMLDIAPPSDREALANFKHFFEREAAAPGTVFAPPAQALEQYVSLMMRVANLNSTRLAWINAMTTSPQSWARGVVREIKGQQPHNEANTIKVWDGGRERRFQVDDPLLLTSLRNMPQHMGLLEGVANGTRRLMQAGATGIGNPAFAPVGLAYESIAATMMHPRGRSFGLFPGDLVGGLAGSVVGAGRGLYGALMRSASHALENAWRNDTAMSRILGTAGIQALARRAAASWSNSTLRAMEQSGALSAGRFVTDPNVRNVYSMLDVVNPNYASRIPLLRKTFEAYRSVLELVQSGARIHYFAVNRGKTDVRTLARETRQLAGDPSVRGGGKIARGIGTLIPYGNVGVQEAAAFGRAFARDPALFATRLGVAVGLPAMFAVWNAARLDRELEAQGQAPVYLDHMFRQQNANQQSTLLNLYLPGVDPRESPALAWPNTFRPIASLVRDTFAAMTNATGEANTARAWDNFFTGFLSALPATPPPALDALAAVAGFDIPQSGTSFAPTLRERRGSPLVGEPGQDVALPANASLAERAAFSTVTGGVAQALLATAGMMGVEATRAALLATRGDRGPRQAVSEAASTVGTIMQRSAPLLNNTLWSTPQRVATQNLDAQLLSSRLNSMKAVSDQVTANIRNPGGTGSVQRSTPLEGIEDVKGVADLQMIPLMMQVSRFYQQIARTDLAAIRGIRSRMDGVAALSNLSPQQRDSGRQLAARELMDAQRLLLERVVDFEQYLSNSYGRHITLDRVSRRSRLADFPPLR